MLNNNNNNNNPVQHTFLILISIDYILLMDEFLYYGRNKNGKVEVGHLDRILISKSI